MAFGGALAATVVALILGAPNALAEDQSALARATPAAKTQTVLKRVGTFQNPLAVTAPPGDRRRLFVAQQRGLIHVLVNGKRKHPPFLDLRKAVRVGAEDGLLGLAFAPDYAKSRLFYVMYNDRAGDVRLTEFKRSARRANRAVRGSGRILLTIEKFSAMHNGGMLQFGRDGHLYVGIGDGGESDTIAAGQFAQDLGSLFGKILRLDPTPAAAAPYSIPTDNPFVQMPGARPEIWAYGLRNPWRFWLDPRTNALLIGDVGALAKEEIDYAKRAGRGLNFGWPCFEGTSPFDPTATCENVVAPLLDYGHGKRKCAVVGGVIVADPRLASLRGQYLYTDVCSQALRAVRVNNGKAAGDRALQTAKIGLPVSFGTDGRERIYVATFTGSVLRLDPPRRRGARSRGPPRPQVTHGRVSPA